MRRLLFILVAIAVLTPWSSPPIALAAGLVLGLTLGNPFAAQSKKGSKYLLQACVVALGFGMNLHNVLKAGASGFVYTAVGIAATLALGLLLGRLLRVGSVEALLISVGTAICGGSAIAAVGPVVDAEDEKMSIALGTVFVLNAVALLAFPFIGTHFALTQEQFGLWAALAIHDTSSVVGAAAKYGAVALTVGTTVKLARALWIVPLTLVIATMRKRSGKVQWPWFVALFVVASIIATYAPAPAVYGAIVVAAKKGLALTLFLIGAGVTRQTLRQVGPRPMMLGVLLWLIVSVTTLLLIRSGVIA